MTDNQPRKMDIDEIMEMLPHRFPFLLVDRITEYVPGKYTKGYKNITFNEPYFTGHFPNKPIFPGVLQIEAMTQMGAAMVFSIPEYHDKFAVLAGIDNARFKKMVRPGDRFDMYAELIKIKGPIVKAHVQGSVDGQLAVEADLLVSMLPGNR